MSQSELAEGDSASEDSDIVLVSAAGAGTGGVTAVIQFVAADDSQPGSDCAQWTLVYTLAQRGDGYWLIDLAEPQAGQPASVPAACP